MDAVSITSADVETLGKLAGVYTFAGTLIALVVYDGVKFVALAFLQGVYKATREATRRG